MMNLPKNWTIAGIEETLARFDNGQTLRQGWSPQCESFPASSEDVWGVLKTTAIQDGEFQPEHNKQLPAKLEPDSLLEVQEGDLLLTCAGPRVRCGVICLVRKTRKRLMVSGKMYRFRTEPRITLATYLEAFLRSHDTKKRIDEMKTGISDSGLNLTLARFKTLQVPFPPLNEQRRIVAKVEELFSELDKGIENLKQARAQLAVYRQALLKHAFEGKLTTDWRTANLHAKQSAKAFLTEIKSIKPYPAEFVSAKDHSIKSWCFATMDELTHYVTSGSRGWAGFYSEKGSVFIRAQNLNRDRLDLMDVAYVRLPEKSEGKRTQTQVGDVFITITGANVTKAGYLDRDIGEAYVSQHVALCRPLNVALSEYLYWYIISYGGGRADLERAAYGAGKPGLNLDNIRCLEVPIPSLSEIPILVAEIRSAMGAVDSLETDITENIRKSEALRQSILKKAFAGELVPQDPADEPAAVLLARIRSEREAKTSVAKPKKIRSVKV